MISVSLSKQLRDFPLQVEFELASGQCLALVGPTGCGKTTTLRLLAGLLQPDAGRIVMDGETLVDTAAGLSVPAQKRRVGVMFQDYALFPHLTVLGNVMYGAQARGASRREAEARARQTLHRARLDGLESLYPRQLSGGQQQRVALARALASGARVLLMDEPMSALDPVTRRQVRGEVLEVIHDLNLQTVVVTHDVADALTLGDRIGVMHEGRIVQLGTRHELLAQPRTPFVAEFLGVNLLQGEASPGPDGLSLVRCGSHHFYTVEQETGAVQVTCHPWDVTLSLQQPDDSSLNTLFGRITSIAHLGGRTRVTVENGVAMVAEVTHASEERLGLKIGANVYASFKASALRVYK
ncbi:MAG: ABC transporter ATP-binding protein [Armatimonadetes bacterium]|nr:ABC transporter ATP-binding protein [Armatimonadota bacterium]